METEFKKPVVGTPATYCGLCDRSPMIITHVSDSGKTVWAAPVSWKIIKGSEQDGSAEYSYGKYASGDPDCFTYRKKRGRFIMKGSASYGSLAIGKAERYRDPHF